MLQRKLKRLLGAVTIGAFIALPASALAQTSDADFDTTIANSYAGAVLAGQSAEADLDLDTAIDLYAKALSYEPDNIDIKQRLMLLLFKSGRFEEGVELAGELKTETDVASVAALALGVDAMRKREFGRAQTQFDAESAVDLERLLNGLLNAWAIYGEGDADKAISEVDSLSGPDWYDIFKTFHIASIHELNGDKDAARRLYTSLILDQQAARTAPDTFIRATMALAIMEARSGNKRAALDALASGSAFANGYMPLETLHDMIEADMPLAADIASPEQGAAAVLFTIGSALNREGAQDYVALYLNFARALDPDNASTLIILGDLAAKLEDIEGANAIYRAIPDNSVMHRVAQLQLGLNLADLGQVEEAKTYLNGLVAENPDDLRSYLALGSVLSEAKEYDEMAENYDKAVKAIGVLPNRSHWNIYFQRGIAYERIKEWDKAEPNFKRALELFPNQPQVMNYLGYSWVDMNINLDEGMALIRDAVRLRPNDGYIVDSLGWAYYRLGEYENAVEELERAAELQPGDPTINDHLGDAYWRAGRRNEARFQWERSLTMEPEPEEIPKIEAKLEKGLPDDPEAKPATANSDKTETQPETESDAPQKESMADPDTANQAAQYKVKPGQTLWNIAAEILGDGALYEQILQANPELDGRPDLIHPGQVINLP
ncbi:tetratricopeptide repeat protein [Hoeflea sp. WL0058]|uniref:Tetratricopeptide repeat protein n=1 Tax=Flavimaribacter sediminis TaxID=2865987 RepID=A0AAE3D3Z3_9HYPH|nr:tetratricopeptide repeat protein [Flavimaribacter sediminis]MBW8640223.1 tetratricopeptide repeat protein [Flavimaribacter sediminis]